MSSCISFWESCKRLNVTVQARLDHVLLIMHGLANCVCVSMPYVYIVGNKADILACQQAV